MVKKPSHATVPLEPPVTFIDHNLETACTVPKIKFMYSRKKGIARAQSQFLHPCVSGLVHIFGCSKIDRAILEINTSLTYI
jgi:hypothetical protein